MYWVKKMSMPDNTQGRSSWSRKNTILFLEKMEMYISANMKIDDAVGYCAYGMKKKKADEILRIKNILDNGVSLSMSLDKTVRLSKTIVNIIRIGEQTGKMKESIGVSKNLLEREEDLYKKIISSATYPILIGIFAGLLLIGLVCGVMPQIIPMLVSLHVKLPLLTRAVIFISKIVTEYGLVIAVILSFVTMGVTFVYKKITPIKYYVHVLLVHIPLLGDIVQKISLSIFMRSFGSMLSSNITIHDAYISSIQGVSLLPLQKKFTDSSDEISSGRKLSDILCRAEFSIPSFATGLILAGEKSGTLGLSMIRVADIIDRDVDHVLKRLTSIVEPVLMVVLGFSIGGIALSIIMPIYDLSKALQH